MVVDAVHHLPPVDLELHDAPGEGPVQARLTKGLPHHQAQGDVAALRVPLGVVLGADAGALLPGGHDGTLPALRDVVGDEVHDRQGKVHGSPPSDGLAPVFPGSPTAPFRKQESAVRRQTVTQSGQRPGRHGGPARWHAHVGASFMAPTGAINRAPTRH